MDIVYRRFSYFEISRGVDDERNDWDIHAVYNKIYIWSLWTEFEGAMSLFLFVSV